MSATKHIPYIPRLLITSVEPILALGGVLTILFSPTTYIHSLTRGLYPAASFDPATQFIYTGQAGSWLYFVFVELFVLKAIDDLRAWRWLCAGMLCSDLLYCHSVAQAVGGWSVWIKILEWTMEDWVVTITTLPFVLIRIAIVAGFWGLGKNSKIE